MVINNFNTNLNTKTYPKKKQLNSSQRKNRFTHVGTEKKNGTNEQKRYKFHTTIEANRFPSFTGSRLRKYGKVVFNVASYTN